LWIAALVAWGEGAPTPVPLTSATVKEATNNVTLTEPKMPTRDAHKGDKLQGGAMLETGSLGSLADLEFDQNHAVYRLASGTLFSFSAETGKLHLTKGLALMSVEGGIVVCETCAMIAAAKSTAILEAFTVKGKPGKPDRCATKFILLEGNGTVSTLDGKHSKHLRGGQMILQYDDEEILADIHEVDLKRLLGESRIITGFKQPLASLGKIQQVVDRQQREMWRGTLEPTGLIIGGRGPGLYRMPNLASPNFGLEAPFDPDIAGGIRAVPSPCLICP